MKQARQFDPVLTDGADGSVPFCLYSLLLVGLQLLDMLQLPILPSQLASCWSKILSAGRGLVCLLLLAMRSLQVSVVRRQETATRIAWTLHHLVIAVSMQITCLLSNGIHWMVSAHFSLKTSQLSPNSRQRLRLL